MDKTGMPNHREAIALKYLESARSGHKSETTDSDIRIALHTKRLRRLVKCPNTLVIDELGLAHAKSRIDIAIINGLIHGYEIKSDMDTLSRLVRQIYVYRQTLQKLTIVSTPKHMKEITLHVPEWCGLLLAEQGPKGGIRFQTLRNAISNPEINPVMMAHLLWRDEVMALLVRAGYVAKELRRPRKQLYEMLCENLTLSELTTAIRVSMSQRQMWRDCLVPA